MICDECGEKLIVTRSGWLACPNGHGHLVPTSGRTKAAERLDAKCAPIDLKQFGDGIKKLD